MMPRMTEPERGQSASALWIVYSGELEIGRTRIRQGEAVKTFFGRDPSFTSIPYKDRFELLSDIISATDHLPEFNGCFISSI